MMVGVLMAMTILYIHEDDEVERVKIPFSKKKINGIFVNNLNLWSEQGKRNVKKNIS